MPDQRDYYPYCAAWAQLRGYVGAAAARGVQLDAGEFLGYLQKIHERHGLRPEHAPKLETIDLLDPACWSWTRPTEEDRAAARADLIGDNTSGLLPDPADVAEHLLWLWQAGRCALCGRPFTTWSELIADLDADAKIRGYVCETCHETISDADNDVRWARYFDRTPAAICGVDAHG